MSAGLTDEYYFDNSGTMELNEAAQALSALAQESRLAVFRFLVARGSKGSTAGEIAEELEIPANTLSFHLNQLAHAGLIESEREGRFVRYRLAENGIRGLIAFLADDCCQGRPELCGLTYKPGKNAKACGR